MNIVRTLRRTAKLQEFVRNRVSLEDCRQSVLEKSRNRTDNFLHCLKTLIYENKDSPYAYLLDLSHISFLDIERVVSRQGVEPALQWLRQEGVYITSEEFKGKKAVIRKGSRFSFSPELFRNRRSDSMGEVHGGGSTGSALTISWTTDYLIERLIHEALIFEEHRLFDAPLALWFPPFPSQLALYPLRLLKLGIVPRAWFSQADIRVKSPLKRVIQTLYSWYTDRYIFQRVIPQYVPLADAVCIAEWASQMIREHTICSIHTFVSGAVRIVKAAAEKNLRIQGTTFYVVGEPLTPQRRREIEDQGGNVIETYYFTEGGLAGASCVSLSKRGDGGIHFFKDSFAVIQHRRDIEQLGQSVDPFLFTSLYPACPVVMLNCENGDYGSIENSECDCSWRDYGYDQVLHSIRSHEKITAEGGTCYIADITTILENDFPRIFGGSSIDYQLVEEKKDGMGLLTVYVHPHVGGFDEPRMKKQLFSQLSSNADQDTCINMWQQVDTIRFIRHLPLATARGKTLSFYRKNI